MCGWPLSEFALEDLAAGSRSETFSGVEAESAGRDSAEEFWKSEQRARAMG